MAVIHEKLTLDDYFSATFTKFLQYGEKAAGASQRAAQAASNYQSVLNSLDRRLISTNAQFASMMQEQQRMAAAGQQNTAAFADLDKRMEKLGGTIRDLKAQYDFVEKQSNEAAAAAKRQADAAQEAAEAQKRAAQEAAEAQKRAADFAAKAHERSRKIIDSVRSSLVKMTGVSFSKPQAALEGLGKQFRRFSLTLFSVSRIFNFMKSSLESAPQAIQNSWQSASNSISRLFGGTVVAALQGLQPHLDRLTAALNSEAGQKLARGLETIARVGGQAIGFVLDKVSQLVEFLGNNFQTVMTVAAVVAGLFAAKMMAAAVATMVANWPLLLIIGSVTLLVTWLMSLGVTTEQIFGFIGGAVAVTAAAIVNTVVGLANGLIQVVWNTFVSPFLGIIEWVLNVVNGGFNSFGGAVANLIGQIISWFLDLGKVVTKIIDAIFGTNWTSGLESLQDKVLQWGKNENAITLSRDAPTIDYRMSYGDAWDAGWSTGTDLANKLSNLSLSNATAAPYTPQLDDIAGSVSSIEKAVDMSQEDLKMLVDESERRYVNRINLTSQTPVITVNGANTGRTAADRQSLANAIRDILIEQTAAGSVISTAVPVVG